MLKKEQLSSSNQILIPSRKFLLLFNDTTVHKCHMVKRSSTIHKLDNAAALCRAHLHTIRGNRFIVLSTGRRQRRRNPGLVTRGARGGGSFCVQRCETAQGHVQQRRRRRRDPVDATTRQAYPPKPRDSIRANDPDRS